MTLILLAGLRALPIGPVEVAQIDGVSGLQVFYYITLPLIKPLIFVAIPGLITTRGTYWGQIAAADTIITIPILIFSLVVQKHLVRGLTFGAIDG